MLVPEFSYYINLGFWYLKLLVILSFPVIGYVIRRKWQFAVAKEAEIKRLMLLAAEEAARAELEAEEVGYYADVGLKKAAFGYRREGPVHKDSFVYSPEVVEKAKCAEIAYQCAVCLSPTTTRCSRCKSIRYCSAKCQIFHWREGHKDKCQPPIIVDQSSDAENYQRSKAILQEKENTLIGSVKTGDRYLKKSRPHLEGNAFRDVDQTEQLQGRSDNDKASVVQDVKPSNSTASFSSSFSSGSSSSSVSTDSSDDASTPERSGSGDLEKSNGHQHADTSVDKHASEIKPSVVKGNTTGRSELNRTLTKSGQCDGQRISYTISNLRVKGSDPLTAKSDAPDFWEGALNYRWSELDKTKSQSKNDDLANIGSSVRCAAGLLGNNANSSHIDGKPHISFSVINEPANEIASSKKIDSWSSEVENPVVTSAKEHKHPKDLDKSVFNIPVGKEVKNSLSAAVLSPPSIESSTVDAQKVNNLTLSSSKKADCILSSTNHKSKPRRSSARNGDGTIHSKKEDNACQASDVPPSQNASRSSLFGERLERALNSTESNCTIQSLKSRLVGSLPSNSHVAHSHITSKEKVVSNVTKVDLVKSNSKAASSEKNGSFKVANGSKTSTWKAVDNFKASILPRRCGVGERHVNKGLFSYELFKNLYGWNKVELQPCGLVNCGNSCYANAVLQCLSFTPPLTAYLLQGFHSKSCTKRDWCFTCEFENLILKAKDGNSPISPIGIISHLPNIGSHLSNGREEDAHEFLRYVVDTMQSICIKEATNKASSAVEEESTLLGLTFGGYLQSKIRCLKCGSKSECAERILDLSVEIEGGIGTLEDALKRFTFPETLDSENKYNCARCKSYQKAKKKLTVLEAPNILTIVLKRFQVGKFGKLNKWIDFPEILDMTPYMSRTSDDKAPVYKLYGVIVHLDTMNATFSGHYVCYVKNIQNKWFKIDDSVVKPVDFQTVKEQAAYMLLYARCLPRAPKSLKDKFICNSKSNGTLPPLTRHSPITSGPNSPYFDHTTSSEACCNGHHVMFETDSYSDNSSLFSSCSDYSCSTDSSNRESNSADDLSDLIFGHSSRGLRYPWKNSSDSDSSSPSSSPSCPGHHHSINRPHMDIDGGIQILCSDPSSRCRNVDYNRSNSSNLRQPAIERLTNVDDVRYGVPSRRSSSGRRG